MTIEEILEKVGEKRILDDGVYDMTGIEFILDTSSEQEVRRFIKKYPKYFIASAYETEMRFLVASKPPRLQEKNLSGSGFNYGSTNIIKNCPKTVLILAEND